MELMLQMGHGMQKLTLELLKIWGNGQVIISPSNFNNPGLDSVKAFANQVQKNNGQVLFDPQMFYPKDGHSKLKKYDYWIDDSVSITSGRGEKKICTELLRINNEIASSYIILPGIEIDNKNLDYALNWLKQSYDFLCNRTDKPLLGTICLNSEVIKDEKRMEVLIEELKKFSVFGYYIIVKPSINEYIISDPVWLTGVMKMLSCLKLDGKFLVLGYSNHQSLIYSLAHVDAIATGTYMNTRCFVPEKFKSFKDDTPKRKSNWYYLPYAFCEYKAALLDIAKSRDFLNLFEPQGEFVNDYSAMLFNDAQPSSTNYNEKDSFMHYLHCLRIQCEMLNKDSYQSTYDTYEFLLNNAETLIKTIKKKGISGHNRDFAPAIEAIRIAMCVNDDDFGFRLRMDW